MSVIFSDEADIYGQFLVFLSGFVGRTASGIDALDRIVQRPGTVALEVRGVDRSLCSLCLPAAPIVEDDLALEYLHANAVVLGCLIQERRVRLLGLLDARDAYSRRIIHKLQAVSARDLLADLLQRDLFPGLRADRETPSGVVRDGERPDLGR